MLPRWARKLKCTRSRPSWVGSAGVGSFVRSIDGEPVVFILDWVFLRLRRFAIGHSCFFNARFEEQLFGCNSGRLAESLREQLASALCLAVVRVLDLRPTGTAILEVRTVSPFCDQSFEVHSANGFEQPRTVSLRM
jgi:hypothetical protein